MKVACYTGNSADWVINVRVGSTLQMPDRGCMIGPLSKHTFQQRRKLIVLAQTSCTNTSVESLAVLPFQPLVWPRVPPRVD